MAAPAPASHTAAVAANGSSSMNTSVWTGVLLGVYILTSTGLIRFNKHMMQTDIFPFSMALTFLHMTVSLGMCLGMYFWKPSLFPGMAATEGKRMDLLKWFVPIGVFFAISLYTSNMAYIYCDVAFLQFMKENNVMICFLLSCAAGSQVLDRLKLLIVAWVVGTSAFTVGGELHFVMVGFLLQAASQIAECSRAVMGELVLNGNKLKLDPLTYTLFTAPTCLVVLFVGTCYDWDPLILSRAHTYWYLLVPNCLVAFVLNLLVATIIKECSAVGFTMAGVLKDIFIVVVSAIAFNEVVTRQQVVGFVASILGIVLWSVLKTQPDSDVVHKMYALVGIYKGPREGESLLSKVPKEYGSKGDADAMERLSESSKEV